MVKTPGAAATAASCTWHMVERTRMDGWTVVYSSWLRILAVVKPSDSHTTVLEHLTKSSAEAE